MKLSRYLFWISIIISVILTLIFFFGAKQVGVLEAKYDLYRGRYEVHGYGLLWGPPPQIEILKPYGIKYRHVAGCAINYFIMDSVASYNSVMKVAIKKDLGFDVDKLWISLYGTTVDRTVTDLLKYE